MPRSHAVSTGCALAITALSLATIPAGAEGQTATIAAAMTAETTLKPPPGMLEALARDLHLSSAQAQARLLNEARLTPIAAQLSKRLGSRFAGTWLRGGSAHTLVVATTSAADIPQILAAGANAEVVTRSLGELAAIKTKLDHALPVKPLVSSARYVDVKRNKVVILAPKPDETQTVVEGIGVNKEAVLVLPSTEVAQPLYDLVGGNAYYIGTASRCSIGFPVVKGTQSGFVSAGHCGKAGDTTTGFNRVAQGVFQGSTFPGSDYSWIAVNSGWTSQPAVDNGEGGTVPVAGARVAIEGASVCRSGSTTDWHCGVIQQRDASVTYPQGTIYQLTRTNVCAEPGDSGGSFISIDQAQGVTSGGSGDCSSGGTTYFQPIGEILTAYGLTLRTTAGNPPPPVTGTCTGFPSTYTGSLTNGQSAYQPRGSYYHSNATGVHAGCLDANDGADFDLYLQKWNGRTWPTVATSDGAGPDEKITYTGTAGYYRYRVVSSSGSSPYTLGYRKP
ncbi:S1 family peptidase [Nonomuraea sp. NEAU-A123]|uniref:S1 family peptidase n=1 Tax=Nonomuraea sp. NEAU-A123 TaxID=2839649 RepID=UPI001BE49EC3|nr:S1 family peptidase [Nonomuraea sp. NEAU-A123]MBT2226388.1 alpha-lytic protease prodomain-containing protein [Nonomuraea sp. NEAU-A123]